MFGRKALLSKVKAAMIFARESNSIVRFDVEQGWLGVTAVSAETGDTRDGLEAVTQGALTFAANGNYVKDALEAADAERLVIRCTSASSPISLRGDGDVQGDLFIVMPMSLGVTAAKTDTPAAAPTAPPAPPAPNGNGKEPAPVPAPVAEAVPA